MIGTEERALSLRFEVAHKRFEPDFQPEGWVRGRGVEHIRLHVHMLFSVHACLHLSPDLSHALDHLPNASALARACLRKSTHASAVTRVSRIVVNNKQNKFKKKENRKRHKENSKKKEKLTKQNAKNKINETHETNSLKNKVK